MWVIVMVAGLIVSAVVLNRFLARDRVAPLERHERALAALRDLAARPRPVVRDVAPPTELPPEHVRILHEAPATARRRRTAARRAAPAARRSATRTTRSRHPAAARATTHPPAEQDRPVIRLGLETDLPDDVTSAIPPPPITITPEAIVLEPPDAAPPAEPEAERPSSAWPSPPRGTRVTARRGLFAAVTVAAALALVAGAVAVASAGGKAHPSATPPVAPPVAQATTTVAPATTVPLQLMRVETLPTGDAQVAVHGTFTLTLHATGPCWVQVTGPFGQTLYQGTLYAGQAQQVDGATPLVVRLGNTPAVGLAVDGTQLDLSGVGRTANVRFMS